MREQKPKILVVRSAQGKAQMPAFDCNDAFEILEVQSPMRALARLARESYAGIYVAGEHVNDSFRIAKLLQNERILEGMPDGVALIDQNNTVIWANSQMRQWSSQPAIVGQNFYAALNSPEILGPDFCPFHTALSTNRASGSLLRSGENQYFQVHAVPVFEEGVAAEYLIVTVRDVTHEVLQQQKMAAIHQAGAELADLTPDELSHMSVEERIELLKSNILHYTKDLLNFDVVEIRLLDIHTKKLEPLLAVGMQTEAADRELWANAVANGVTGFVAATGNSYLCEDTRQDPLYLEGSEGARSSLTVPLILHDEVIGTFNVESPEPRAFSESDQQFLEIFTRNVAVALNTLELLVAEKAGTAQESVEAIYSAVALPIDDILNDAVHVMERFVDTEPEVAERLLRILRNARDIKQVIQTVGQRITPPQALAGTSGAKRPALNNKRILVVDADEAVRGSAHSLLERYGCIIETAHDAGIALSMIRNADENYDAIIADIRMPDISGYQFLLKLQEILDPVPLILMTGFGYDPGHSIPKCRQAGLEHFLYKPFRVDQLIETVERILVVRPQTLVSPSKTGAQ